MTQHTPGPVEQDTCPACGSDNIEWGEKDWLDGDTISQYAVCQSCHAEWQEHSETKFAGVYYKGELYGATVTACNCHDELVEALREICHDIDGFEKRTGHLQFALSVKHARAALAKAEGKL